MIRIAVSAQIVVLVVMLCACSGSDKAAPSSTTASPALSDASLLNATYPVEQAPEGKVTLINGTYVKPAPPNLTVTLHDTRARGRLDGDGSEDAAVVYFTKTDGTGTFYYLAAVLNQNGSPVTAATAFLGDRILLKSLGITDGVIKVEMTISGPNDPACCPATQSTRTYTLQGNKLQLQSQTP